VAWKGDAALSLPGFTFGNNMIFKVRADWQSEIQIFNPQVIYSQGDGTFGFGTFSIIDLDIETQITTVENISFENKVELHCYPNPFSNQLIVEFNTTEVSEITVSIIDIQGKEFFKVNNHGAKNLNDEGSGKIKVTYKGLGLTAGLYMVNLTTGNKTITKKVMAR
jgi:hypothetical protein